VLYSTRLLVSAKKKMLSIMAKQKNASRKNAKLLSAILLSSRACSSVRGLSLSTRGLLSPQPLPPNPSFVVAQYNVLAGTLGSNTHPWFLHGLTDLTDERRAAITEKFYRRDPTTGKLLKIGWPDHAEGILSEDEQRVVEDVDRRFFDWNIRKDRLLRTVQELNADLISLVECDHYETFWETEMDRLGYSGVYKRRPRSGCSDGCAIFFRRDAFELLDYSGVELTARKSEAIDADNILEEENDGEAPTISRIGETVDRVALLAMLRHIPTNRHLIFVSTHLARNPEDRGKTKERARQIAQILYQVTQFAEEHEQRVEAPVVLAGDLNDTTLWHLGTMARIKFGVAGMIGHPFIFTSRAAASPTPTSITSCRSVRIDYILLQPSLLEVCESVFEMGQDENGEGECRIIPDFVDHIPNEQHPSDHVPIAFRILFKDYHSAAEGCAASWVEVVASPQSRPSWSPSSGAVLRLEELEAAFNYFDRDRDGICDPLELSLGLKKLAINDAEAVESFIEEALDITTPSLTLDEFRALYVKIWLQQQRSFLDRVRSVRNMFHLSVDSTSFSSGSSDCLYAEMDVGGNGIVTIEDIIDHLASVERSEDSLRERIADTFSLFELGSGNDVSMQDLHQCFVDACPFEVTTDVLQVAFHDMGKAHDERVQLDDFIDWLIRRYFRKDIGWITLVGPVPK